MIADNSEMTMIAANPPTRLAVIWDGERWAEIDPESGYCVAVGNCPETPDGSDKRRSS